MKQKRSFSPKAAPATVEEYFARVPASARRMLQEMRATIRSTVPADATEVISYSIPAFKKTRIIVWYAAFSKHCSLFPTAEVIAALKKELAGFTTSKGTVQFPLDRPLPVSLIRKMVKMRVRKMNGD